MKWPTMDGRVTKGKLAEMLPTVITFLAEILVRLTIVQGTIKKGSDEWEKRKSEIRSIIEKAVKLTIGKYDDRGDVSGQMSVKRRRPR